MVQPIPFTDIDVSELKCQRNVRKVEKLFETQVYLKTDGKAHNVLFWTPEVKCVPKDGKLSLMLSDDELCESLYTLITSVDQKVTDLSVNNWVKWFGKDDITDEDIIERYRTPLKAGSKQDGRVFQVKISPDIRCKDGETDVSIEDIKETPVNAKVLLELKRIVFGRGSFKLEYIAHQLLVQKPVDDVKDVKVEDVDEEPECFVNDEWLNP